MLDQIDHPTFGPCDRVPTLLAVRWKEPRSREAITAELAERELELARAFVTNPVAAAVDVLPRDPARALVNQSPYLSFVTGSAAAIEAFAAAPPQDAAWVGGVYSAQAADESAGERTFFAIDPTVLILTQAAVSRLGGVAKVADDAVVEQARTNIMRGFAVVRLPGADALEAWQALDDSGVVDDLPNAVSFENIPYLLPLAAGCCSEASTSSATDCAPSRLPHVPSDGLFALQWGLQRIQAPSAWPHVRGSASVVVAVIDQGVDLGHPDLNLWPISYSTITHTYDGSPVGPHGTTCAGIIASRMDNGLGAAGLAPECPVMAIATHFADTEVAEGLFFAADNGARVVSMSFGVYASWMVWNFAIIEAALQYCAERNVVLVAATGNEDQILSRFPGSDPRTIGVGGSNRDDVRKAIGDLSSESWWGACYGPSVDVVAPCLEIPTTDIQGGGGYTTLDYTTGFNGTSAATPHVAALAGLLLSLDRGLSAEQVRRVISETADKINAGNYVYAPTAGRPYGTWNDQVGYGRINVERAVLAVCQPGQLVGPCAPNVPALADECTSPVDPPWIAPPPCMHWYEEKIVRLPLLGREANIAGIDVAFIEIRVTYDHVMCLLGKHHGRLLYTTTLLPGETVRIHHSERYRRITSAQQRYSVQTTFMQFLSRVHQARASGSIELLREELERKSAAGSEGGGFLLPLPLLSTSSRSAATETSSLTSLSVRATSESFEQSVHQASELTHAERSIVVSVFEDREIQDATVRILENKNECHAVTYFVRQVLELYAVSTRVFDVSFRVSSQAAAGDAGGTTGQWRDIDAEEEVSDAIWHALAELRPRLPRVGEEVGRPRPLTVPTDGVVFNAELARCGSCEPQRVAAIDIRLQRQQAMARKECLEVEMLELELRRRRMLLERGSLRPFDGVAAGREGEVSGEVEPGTSER